MATLQSRFSFTFHFLVGAASLAKLAFEIDKKGNEATEQEKIKHLAYVSGSIMQSVAALESEVWILLNHGTGHHLGSDVANREDAESLLIVADSFDKHPILERYDLILQLIRRKKLNSGEQPTQDVNLLIKLRNEITHYKSLFTPELETKKLFRKLESTDSNPPSFYPKSGMNFFPKQCLNFNRAEWGLNTSISFINYFYKELDIKSSLKGHDMELLKVR